MTGSEIADLLIDVKSWHDATSFQRGNFAYEMIGRSYGRDAITQAWCWFLTGWNSREQSDD